MLPGLFKKENVRDLNKSTFYDWRPSDIQITRKSKPGPVHETRPFLIGTKTKSFHRNDHDRIPTQARSRNERNSVRTELRSSPRYDRAGYLIVQEVQGGTGSCRIRWSTVKSCVVKETPVKRLCNIRLWIEIVSAFHQQNPSTFFKKI